MENQIPSTIWYVLKVAFLGKGHLSFNREIYLFIEKTTIRLMTIPWHRETYGSSDPSTNIPWKSGDFFFNGFQVAVYHQRFQEIIDYYMIPLMVFDFQGINISFNPFEKH